MTVEYARANDIKIAGIILNNYEKDNSMHQDNLKQVFSRIVNTDLTYLIKDINKNEKDKYNYSAKYSKLWFCVTDLCHTNVF